MPEKKLLEWSPRSERNVRRIRAYIATDNPKAAQDVVDEIVISAAGLRNFPLIGKLSDAAGVRELVLAKYPYTLIYRVSPDKIRIVAVLHQSQDHA